MYIRLLWVLAGIRGHTWRNSCPKLHPQIEQVAIWIVAELRGQVNFPLPHSQSSHCPGQTRLKFQLLCREKLDRMAGRIHGLLFEGRKAWKSSIAIFNVRLLSEEQSEQCAVSEGLVAGGSIMCEATLGVKCSVEKPSRG